MTLPKKALIAITSYHARFYEDKSKTGLFYNELAEPWYVFSDAGFEVQFISESGNFGLDDHCLSKKYVSQEIVDDYHNEESKITKLLKLIKMASDINPDDYSVFFASSGHAALFDYPTASTLQDIAYKIYSNGGIISAVSHGPSLFANLNNRKGEPLISRKKITGFSDKGEEILDISKLLVSRSLKTCEQIIADVEGCFIAAPEPFWDFHLEDDRIVTGSNPQSVKSTAEKVVEIYNTL